MLPSPILQVSTSDHLRSASLLSDAKLVCCFFFVIEGAVHLEHVYMFRRQKQLCFQCLLKAFFPVRFV